MDRNIAAPLVGRTLSLRRRSLLIAVLGLVLIAAMSLASTVAFADVDATGGLTRFKASPLAPKGIVQPLVDESHNGLYECSTAFQYSPVHAEAFGFVVGNCKAGWKFEVVDYGGPSKGNYSYGGNIPALSTCGWIESDHAPAKISGTTSGACNKGTKVSITPEAAYLERHNSKPEDGTFVVNKVACPEYANYEPWSKSTSHEIEEVGVVQPYEANVTVPELPALKWRYITTYSSTDGSGKYVLARVTNKASTEGQTNWVFVPRSCLPSELPEADERRPPAPTATTEAASSVTTSTATISGQVNPNGVDTHYYFEYGKEAAKPYEAINPTPYPGEDLGAGKASIPRAVNITGLAPGVTYYYRIVASSPTGVTEGGLGSFATAVPTTPDVISSRTALREPTGLDQWVYYVGEDGQVHDDFFEGKTWTSGLPASGVAVAANSNPTVVREAGGPGGASDQWVYYIGTGGQIYVDSWNGTKWENTPFVSGAPAAAVNTSPTATREPSGPEQWVYYVGESGQIYDDYFDGKNWTNGLPISTGKAAAANSSPTVLREPGGAAGASKQWVYYVGIDGQIYADSWDGTKWTNVELVPGGEAAAANTSPAAVFERGGVDQWVYYVGANHQIYVDSWNGSKWENSLFVSGAHAAANTSPTAIREPTGLDQWVYYVSESGQIYDDFFDGKTWTNGLPISTGKAAAANSSPTLVREPGGAAGSSDEWVYYLSAGTAQLFTDSWNTKEWENPQLVMGAEPARLPTI